MIDIRHIVKRFGDLEVLRGIDLRIEKGEMVSIVGKSGAGKTTLLQILGTLDHPTSGQVVIDGTDVFSLSESRLAEYRNKHIGFIFQFHQLLPEFTAEENVMIPCLIGGMSRSAARQKADRLLGDLGLSDRLNHKPAKLSGGEKQRVAAARAMIMEPDIILADEPTGSLDEQSKQELTQLLRQMQQRFGQTILIVTHDMDLAKTSDRIIEIRDGVCHEQKN